jgi:hypothetical protein
MTSLGVFRNHLATATVTAVKRYLPSLFRRLRLQTIEARANYVCQLFKSDNDHPIIWREYVEGNIQNHPEVGGYKTTRRGVFQSDPILETLLSYHSSSGIMESPPTEDPGPGNRPIGVLALATAAVRYISALLNISVLTSPLGQVERAYKMYATGNFVEPTQQFNAELCGPRTARYMDHITNDLNERQWNSILSALASFSIRTAKEEAVHNGASEEPCGRVPLPASDPPSPRDD